MNFPILKDYIEKYKEDFSNISRQEIYKWKAIKQFRENFDIDASDFHKMLETSLKKANNLLASANYLPKKTLLSIAEKSPEEVRVLFKNLYNEEEDIKNRIQKFRVDFQKLNKIHFEGLNDYQDHRAVNVYLTLNFPDRYFFYKYGMFNEFAKRVEHPITLTKGRVENVTTYIQLCKIVKLELEKDETLLKLSSTRLKDDDCHDDPSHNVLTQDFIYAVARHFPATPSLPPIPGDPEPETIIEVKHTTEIEVEIHEPVFSGVTTHDEHNEQARKALGTLGEKWVINIERQNLIKKGLHKLAAKVTHSAQTEGDGLGYDILSYDEAGRKKYIEVKTTTYNKNKRFYITRNELEWSKKEKDNFYLYRVYDYNQIKNSANLLIMQGDLTNLCQVPINYQVDLS